MIPTGIKHGTVTVICDDMPIEITTFRNDGLYSDNRRPDSVTFSSSFEEDAARRDFTVNAISYNDKEGILDPFGGIDDIRNRIIRTVGDPDRRFEEDALRIIRAIRFASVLGFDIDEKTASSAIKNRHLLKNIAAERISVEFTKLLTGANAMQVLLCFPEIIFEFIPEARKAYNFNQHNFHHIYSVWEHTCHTVGSIEPVPVLRLAAFFHDIAKPFTFSLDSSGTGHFYSHASTGAELTEDIMSRLKYDSKTIRLVSTLVKYHDLQIPEDKKTVKKHVSTLSADTFHDLMKLCRADTLALAPEFSFRTAHFDKLDEIADEIQQADECLSIKSLAISGNDLIALGIPQGKEIGRILNELFSLVINDEIVNERESLLEKAQKLAAKNPFDFSADL